MNDQSLADKNAECLRAVANALCVDQGLIDMLRQLAPQWGSSTGKTRSYSGLNKDQALDHRCIVRVDSRTAILLNDAIYQPSGPTKLASQLRGALRNPEIDATATRCVVHTAEGPAIQIRIDQYADADGNEVAPDSPQLHHRVVSIMPA